MAAASRCYRPKHPRPELGGASAGWVVKHEYDGYLPKEEWRALSTGAAASRPGSKIDSIGLPKRRAMRNARGRLGSYFPVSMALAVWLETPRCSARSACDQSLSA